MTEFDAVVVAAGASSRMGRWKLLLPWGDSTLVQAVVENALKACPRVLLVTGYCGDQLAKLFSAEPRVVCVVNSGWEAGMTGSVATGARCVETERFFVALADMPLVVPELYLTLAARTEKALACRPIFQGRLGHPVLFHRSVAPLIEALRPEDSMRELFFRLGPKAVEIDDPGCIEDLDSPEDWERLKSFAPKRYGKTGDGG